MTVYGADAVEAAAAGGAGLRVGPGDLVTPLARERAAERGVEIISAGAQPSSGPAAPSSRPVAPSAPAVPGAAQAAGTRAGPDAMRAMATALRQPVPPPLRPPSPALFRRGAPLHPAVTDPAGPAAVPSRHAPSRDGDRVERIVIVGAGHVGMITAMRLAEADLADEIVLVDIADGLAAGIALDITHTAALLGFSSRLRGVTSVEEAGPADYVVITAGRPRSPGMSRTDLVSTNAAIVGDIAGRVASVSPDAVLVVVTNPLDEMTHHAWRASGFPAARVLGMAGVLDTARFQSLLALTGVASAGQVGAVALGSHGDEMVIPLSQITLAGRALGDRLPSATTTAVVDRARGSGAEVVGLLKSGSAFMAPGTSAAHMVMAMARGSGGIVPATVRADGRYGIHDVFVGLPVRLGRHGVTEIVELDLTSAERAELRAAADRITERVAAMTASDRA